MSYSNFSLAKVEKEFQLSLEQETSLFTDVTKMEHPPQHAPFLLILLLHLMLAVAYSVVVPLGEAPDEPAHLAYARFIARHGRPPATLAEREAAGYRSAWPPLYHYVVAGPVAAVGDAPPTRLKAVGDTARRLIPTNGQTIASFIHTADEAWPWRGVTLAWHWGRLVSVTFSALAVTLTYRIAYRLTGRPYLATGAMALHAFLPQALFIAGTLNDDDLLIVLAGLIFLTLVGYTQNPTSRQAFLLGVLLGLATITKYNALPLWVIILAGLFLGAKGQRGAKIFPALLPLLVGAGLTAGGWFIFIWLNFSRVDELGPVVGSLAALTAGTADTSLRQLTAGGPFVLPPTERWLEWFVTLFKSLWGLFGGGGTIEFPGWLYGLLALLCLVIFLYTLPRPKFVIHHFFLLSPLFFLPLPLLRFVLTGGNIVETAQGRHLFPALPAIALGLAWGAANILPFRPRRPTAYLALCAAPLLLLNLYALILNRAAYPPPIPLFTTPPAGDLLAIKMAEEVTLAGYEVGEAGEGLLPLTLLWRVDAIPSEDYLISLSVSDTAGQPLGGWLGHPVGGRYPARALDAGDFLRDTVLIPLLPGRPAATATLTLELLNDQYQPARRPVTLSATLPLPATPRRVRSPGELRADGLAPADPFTYRSTLTLVWLAGGEPALRHTGGAAQFSPTQFWPGEAGGGIAHFLVGADWPSGDYEFTAAALTARIHNRSRQFAPPVMMTPLNANFADHLTLLGYDLPERRVKSGEKLSLTLHWRAEKTIGQDLTVFNHLLDREAVQRGGADRIPQNHYTTLLWVPGEIVSDAYRVPVDGTAPPGVYWLDVGLYPSQNPRFSLPLFVEGHPIPQNSVRLGPLKVGGPPPGVTVAAGVQPQQPLHHIFGEQITLLGFNLKPTAEAGAKFRLVLFWRAEGVPPADYTVFVHLLDEQGRLVTQADGPPANNAYPTSLWEAGEIIVDERTLFPGPGTYTLQVGLYHPPSGERLPPGAVTLTRLVAQ
jgi:hypothetical protein